MDRSAWAKTHGMLGALAGRRVHWSLAGLLLVHLAANAVWITRDVTLRAEDAGPQLDAVAQAYNVIAEQGLSGIWQVARGKSTGIWPGAGYLLWVAAAAAVGPGITSLRLLNLLFIGVLVVAVFGLGRWLSSSRVGLLAAALVSLFPLIYGEGRQFGVDLPGAAMTALAVWALVSTDRLSRPGRCVLLGLAVGLGALIRPQVLFFVLPVGLVFLLLTLLERGTTPRVRVLGGALVAAAVAAATSAVWWLGRLGELASMLSSHQQGLAHHGTEQGALISGVAFYLQLLPWAVTPFQLLALVVAGGALVAGLRGRSWARELLNDPRLVLVLTWLIAGFVILALLRARSLRYLAPLCPALALIIAHGLCAIPHRLSRRVIVSLVLGVAALGWLVDSFIAAGPLHYGLRPGEPLPTHVSHGPPALDRALQTAFEVADLLASRFAGGGERLGVRLEDRCDRWPARMDWLSSPVLRTRFRGIRIMGIHDRIKGQGGAPPNLHIGRASLPPLKRPATRCFRLTCRPGPPTEDRPEDDPTTRRFERILLPERGAPRGMTIALWQTMRCEQWRRIVDPVLPRPRR